MANESPSQGSPQSDENRLIAERRAKLAAHRERAAAAGVSAFPNDFRRDSLAGELLAELGEKEKAELETLNRLAAVTGRVMRKRGPFLVIQDPRAPFSSMWTRRACRKRHWKRSRAGISVISSLRGVRCTSRARATST